MIKDNIINFNDYKTKKSNGILVFPKALEYSFPVFIPFVGWINYKISWGMFKAN